MRKILAIILFEIVWILIIETRMNYFNPIGFILTYFMIQSQIAYSLSFIITASIPLILAGYWWWYKPKRQPKKGTLETSTTEGTMEESIPAGKSAENNAVTLSEILDTVTTIENEEIRRRVMISAKILVSAACPVLKGAIHNAFVQNITSEKPIDIQTGYDILYILDQKYSLSKTRVILEEILLERGMKRDYVITDDKDSNIIAVSKIMDLENLGIYRCSACGLPLTDEEERTAHENMHYRAGYRNW